MLKFASLENVQVLELKGASAKVRHASLGKLADFHQYRTDDGYLYARIRAISSRCNKNHDGWPSIELAGGQDIFDRHLSSVGFTMVADNSREYGFSTFLGKPIFIDHHNSDPKRARGVIVDASLHVDDHKTSALDPYYSSPDVDPEHLPGTWVELLLEVDAKAFPKFAKAIVEGSRNPKKGIDGWSMGCDVDHSVCSICKNSASSPEDYCQHIKLKGAYFDHIDEAGHKTSKKAYENCYGVKFFEISGVFEPADETALSLRNSAAKELEDADSTKKPLKDLADLKNEEWLEESGEAAKKRKKSGSLTCPNCGGGSTSCPMCRGQGYLARSASVRLAENPLPQAELSHAPEHVDTLREETICPVCGSSMDEDTCDVCGYQEPPEGFGNPDLTKAQDVDVPTEPGAGPDLPPEPPNQLGSEPMGAPESTNTPKNPTALAHVTSDMDWDVHSRTSARINKIERPLVPNDEPKTNEPKETIVADQLRPVTSRVRTAEDFIAAAGATRRNTEMNHTADAASGAPAVAKPDVHTEVTGVGGVDQASNEAASKADAQVDVTAIGGTGVESVAAEKEGVNVEQGDEHSKNIEAIPTMTWSDGKGDSLGQHDPVTSEPFPASEDGVHASHWIVEGYDDAAFPPDEAIGGGTAVRGVKPIAEQFGDRVNVLEHVTSPANNSGPTKTWSGTDGNGVLKQQDPVTPESIALGESGIEGAPNWTASTHIFASFKLADLEVELGLLPAEKKYERAAELERETPTVVEASLKYAQRVKHAALRRTAGVAKLPVMGHAKPIEKEAAVVSDTDDAFMFGGV